MHLTYKTFMVSRCQNENNEIILHLEMCLQRTVCFVCMRQYYRKL